MSEPKGNVPPSSPLRSASASRSGPFSSRLGLVLLLLIALSAFLVIGAVGGGLPGHPDVPQGMQWINADDSWSSYWVLRGGPHLMIESNKRAELVMVGGLSVLLTVIGYVLWRLFHDRPEALRLKKEMTSLRMYLACTILLLILPVVGFSSLADFIRGKTVELNPVVDRVMLDGVSVTAFHDVRQFSWYTTRGSKGGLSYHLEIDLQGRPSINIDAVTMREDVRSLAPYLNTYLAEVRSAPGAPAPR